MRILIAITFFALAAWFLFGATSTSMPSHLGGSAEAPVSVGLIDPQALRVPLTDPPQVKIGGLMQGCMDCHFLFPSKLITDHPLQQHRHLRMDHGLNDRCFNCHAYGDRSKLVLHDGELIGFEDSVRLCAKCHGPTWRDWDAGMHGRTMGSWDAASGRQQRLVCIQCHDPHAPAFDPIAPLPGPDTLRMGEEVPDHAADPTAVRNPLELRADPTDEHPDAVPHETGVHE